MPLIIEAHKFQVKPKFIEAIQYVNKIRQFYDKENMKNLFDFCGVENVYFGEHNEIFIQLSHGVLIVHPGEFIVKSECGNYSVMDANTFFETYEKV